MTKLRPLEGATPLSEEDQEGLIPAGVRTRQQLNAAEFENINEAVLKYLVAPPSRRKASFTHEWLRKLHAEMFGRVWRWAGKLGTKELSVGVPVHKISQELKQFEGDFKAWEDGGFDPVEISARIHHKLVWIHPFSNGNGRWARLAANIYLRQKQKSMILWPEDEIFIRKSFRKLYIQALKSADLGHINALADLHIQYSKTS